ncbi:uncharacterized protein LOC132194089 [Neocloeon triangulifer]|uniref:uncharacterized protein LOC132194089 n=1 Tax=Neocloeon triangulifer TaxID=2078957 RepID=UPI00286FA63D|nr:uncharacterized protein LOC132194089 [Neocloeon triangulifer]
MPSSSEYNEIKPKLSSTVRLQWKVLQTMIFAATAVCGYACAIIFGYWLQGLESHCPLFADIKFLKFDNTSTSSTLEIDFTASKWGKDALCSFCQFVPLLTAVYAFIWGGSFACCGRGGKSPDGVEPWKLVFAALAFSLIFMPIAIAAAALTTSGLSESCESLSGTLEEMGQLQLARDVCTGKVNPGVKIPETSSLEVLKVVAWMSASGWGLAAVLLFIRYLCLADFEEMPRKCSNLTAKSSAASGPSTSSEERTVTIEC